MIIPPAATSVSLDVQIVDDSGAPVTGLVAATFPPVYYAREREAAVQITPLSDLALITTAFTAKGVKERTGSAGFYRLDVPDAAWTTASRARIYGEATGKHLICPDVTVGNPVVVLTAAYDRAKTALEISEYTAPNNTGIGIIIGTLGTPAGATVSDDVAAIPDALLDRANGVETGWTLRQVFRLLASAMLGKSSNNGNTFRDLNDTKDRIVGTVDASENRTAVTKDAS